MVESKQNIKSDKELEEKIWVKIPNKSGTWKPVNVGDELIGTYIKKHPSEDGLILNIV